MMKSQDTILICPTIAAQVGAVAALGVGAATAWLRLASIIGPNVVAFMVAGPGLNSLFLVFGLVALAAGAVWGSKLGVQFSLSQVALKALPVVILGGLTSVPGAIVGGLIIGVGEKLSEVYIGPFFGGGIEIWFAYVLALLFLLVRPQGLYGEKIIDRV